MISRGDSLIATLLNGSLEGHRFNIYEAHWLQESQEGFAHWAIRECFKDHDLGAIVEPEFVSMRGRVGTAAVLMNLFGQT